MKTEIRVFPARNKAWGFVPAEDPIRAVRQACLVFDELARKLHLSVATSFELVVLDRNGPWPTRPSAKALTDELRTSPAAGARDPEIVLQFVVTTKRTTRFLNADAWRHALNAFADALFQHELFRYEGCSVSAPGLGDFDAPEAEVNPD